MVYPLKMLYPLKKVYPLKMVYLLKMVLMGCHWFWWVSIDFHGFPSILIDPHRSGYDPCKGHQFSMIFCMNTHEKPMIFGCRPGTLHAAAGAFAYLVPGLKRVRAGGPFSDHENLWKTNAFHGFSKHHANVWLSTKMHLHRDQWEYIKMIRPLK